MTRREREALAEAVRELDFHDGPATRDDIATAIGNASMTDGTRTNLDLWAKWYQACGYSKADAERAMRERGLR